LPTTNILLKNPPAVRRASCAAARQPCALPAVRRAPPRAVRRAPPARPCEKTQAHKCLHYQALPYLAARAPCARPPCAARRAPCAGRSARRAPRAARRALPRAGRAPCAVRRAQVVRGALPRNGRRPPCAVRRPRAHRPYNSNKKKTWRRQRMAFKLIAFDLFGDCGRKRKNENFSHAKWLGGKNGCYANLCGNFCFVILLPRT
jgi:hypothetical protein